MSIFKSITLTFKGKEFTVPADQVMKLICKVEDSISLQELTRSEGPRLTRLAEAYTAALNHAGANVTHEEVYSSLFGAGGTEVISAATTGLLCMLIPPEHYHAADSGNDQPPATETPAE